MRYVPLFILLIFPFMACGQGHENREEKLYFPKDASYSNLIENNNAYASAILGNGFAYGEGVVGDRSMEGRTFEFRFGKEISVPAFLDEKFRVDFIHFNEGHPDNNHRDGFAGQIVYRKPLNQKLNLEFGLGPYFSMNTTTIKGVEINDAKLGALLSIAALVDIERYSPGLHMRFALNHVSMPETHSSIALLVGVGKYFDNVPARIQSESYVNPIWLGVTAGIAQTNHGESKGAPGFSAEAKKYFGNQWGASISGIMEGDDEVRVHRHGVAAQGWFVQPLDENWAVSAGVGPYVATNKRGSGDLQLHGLISLQVERFVGKKWKGFVNFNRVATFTSENDRDLLRIGVMRRFDM
ncbi:hypothetical protein [Candidatus Nitrotoga sp. 1052]|uniref:hypothetical protein n=1 Tax=Candidatus Nitrotoga sp. 1052 TaxID=2886964 RepID=UPI001EF5631F|nr:hypothetical protein [Candidatus Nitrotoga sp. 1052]CAH1082168.1 conserved hypothetical protein [Candidatus Nitrotoga sp. 1052]